MSKRRNGPGPKKLAKLLTRIHEAGHVVIAWFDPLLPKVLQATSEPDGEEDESDGVLGSTLLRWEEHHQQLQSYEETLALIRFALGGRVAEELFGRPNLYGASGDLPEANRLIHDLVMNTGMSEEFGHILPEFLAMSDATKQRVDEAMMSIMRKCTAETRERLAAKKDLVLEVAEALEERGTLKTKHLKKILGPRPARKYSIDPK